MRAPSPLPGSPPSKYRKPPPKFTDAGVAEAASGAIADAFAGVEFEEEATEAEQELLDKLHERSQDRKSEIRKEARRATARTRAQGRALTPGALLLRAR